MSEMYSHLYAQRSLILSLGGEAGAVNTVAKAAVRASLADTGLEPWVVHKHLDFPAAGDGLPSELVRRYGRHAEPFGPDEAIDLLIDPLKEIAVEHDFSGEFANLARLCPRAILLASRSDQAGQKPAVARASLWFSSDGLAGAVEAALTRLDTAGFVPQELRRSGFSDEQISRRIRISLIAGGEGGTGNGGLPLAALIASSVARYLNIPIEMEAFVGYGYRAAYDEEAALRRALGEQFSRDLEQLQCPGKQLGITTPRGIEHTAVTPLFTRVIAFEGHGSLRGDAEGLALSMGEAIAFRATSRAAAQINIGHAQNILSRTRNY